MNRSEHMQWSKDRAIEIANSGNITGAMASIASDLNNHVETAGHKALDLMMLQVIGGHLSSKEQMVNYIEGIN